MHHFIRIHVPRVFRFGSAGHQFGKNVCIVAVLSRHVVDSRQWAVNGSSATARPILLANS